MRSPDTPELAIRSVGPRDDGRSRSTDVARCALAALLLATVLAPAASGAADVPRLTNEREVLEPVMSAMMETGLVADGTVFAAVAVTPDGRVGLRALHGGVAQNGRLAELVRDATIRARFLVPSEWSSANPRGSWAMFWAFQTNGCTPWAFDAPARATVIRVCLSVVDGAVDPGGSSYLVDATPAPRAHAGPEPRYRATKTNPYPNAAREAGIEGHVTMRVRLDERGRVTATEVREDTVGPLFGPWLERWRKDAEFEIPAGWPGPGRSRIVDLRIAFAIAPHIGSDCAWVLRKFDGLEHRVCVSPISSRP